MPRMLKENYIETIYNHVKGGDLTLTQAADQLGWSRQTIERVCKRYGVTMKAAIRGNNTGLSPERRAEILEALKGGLTRMQTCLKYDVKLTTLDNWIKKARLIIPIEKSGRKVGNQHTVKMLPKKYVSPETPEFRAKQIEYYQAKLNARWFGGHGA